jgi:hypothetical protein
LSIRKDHIDYGEREMKVYDRAIAEVEEKYGHVLYSPDFFFR